MGQARERHAACDFLHDPLLKPGIFAPVRQSHNHPQNVRSAQARSGLHSCGRPRKSASKRRSITRFASQISFPEIQIAFYSYLYNYDNLLFLVEPHRPCGSMSFAKAILSPQLNWGALAFPANKKRAPLFHKESRARSLFISAIPTGFPVAWPCPWCQFSE